MPKRDDNGRFIKNTDEEKTDREQLINFLGIVTILALVGIGAVIGWFAGVDYGAAEGYSAGYSAGITDNQQAIFDDGLRAGAELERNWTYSPYTNHYGLGTILCSKTDPNHCKSVDDRMNMRWEYTLPNYTYLVSSGVYL